MCALQRTWLILRLNNKCHICWCCRWCYCVCVCFFTVLSLILTSTESPYFSIVRWNSTHISIVMEWSNQQEYGLFYCRYWMQIPMRSQLISVECSSSRFCFALSLSPCLHLILITILVAIATSSMLWNDKFIYTCSQTSQFEFQVKVTCADGHIKIQYKEMSKLDPI